MSSGAATGMPSTPFCCQEETWAIVSKATDGLKCTSDSLLARRCVFSGQGSWQTLEAQSQLRKELFLIEVV